MMVRSVIFTILILHLAKAPPIEASVAMAGCKKSCDGDNVTIPFPFGIGSRDCYFHDGFAVTCKDIHFNGSLKPFLTSVDLEVLHVSLDGHVRVNIPVFSSNCSNININQTEPLGVNLSGSPFTFSRTYNKFMAFGCNNYATLISHNKSTLGGCLSICPKDQLTNQNGIHCDGLDCCQIDIPLPLNSFDAQLETAFDQDCSTRDNSDCKYASVIDQEWFQNFDSKRSFVKYMANKTYVPAVLEWGQEQGYCQLSDSSYEILCSPTSDGHCWAKLDSSHLVVCGSSRFYYEIRYIPNFNDSFHGECQAAEECTKTDGFDFYDCKLICLDTPQSSGCPCPSGYSSYAKSQYCEPHNSRVKTAVIIGCSSGSGGLLLVISLWFLYKAMKKRKEIKLKQKHFKRNGGLLLHQQLSSTSKNIERTKLFTCRELEQATDSYHVNRILGQGGQGTVYKGMLTDGKIVAVKKSKLIDTSHVSHFINEVIIVSQINHRNIVKVIGCCLETEVPLLVYEFIPNGTLFQLIHDKSQEFITFTWDMRLRIAAEIANALSYLHSAASAPIYHRDIKSTNILLDEKYRAKVSDFGISRSISIDETHLTTIVEGTFGYLDPEFFQSSQFTEKSDVYSFGVVLAELLTAKKPINQSVECRSLATFFLLSMEENRLFEILDSQVIMGREDEIIVVAQLAEKCLNMNGRNRPTMKEVAKKLEGIRMSLEASFVERNPDEADSGFDDILIGQWDPSSSSYTSCFNSGLAQPIDEVSLILATQ